ncbi:MAG TPA: tetratricopeptide repeat protein [Terriglobales bacterium]|nr:tetratricopeptide repeat protein [Terriglobales bacterium]
MAICLAASLALGQNTGRTVRHHKVEVQGGPPPELAQAEAAIGKQDYAAAEPLLKKALQADPNNYVAWFDLGFTDHALGKNGEAIAAYRKSVAAKGDVFESNLNLGILLAEAHQPDAEQFLRAATKLKPTAEIDEGHARAWMALADALEATQPDQAIQAYQQAAALRPKDPDPLLSAGVLLEKQNRPTEAEQEYKAALAIDPSSKDALTALANLYMRSRRFSDARDVLTKLQALRPSDPAVMMQLGRLLAAQGKNDQAISQLEAAQKLAPNDPALRRDLADLYLSQRKFDRAEAQYRALLAAAPRDAELHDLLGRCILEQKRYAEAQSEFGIAVSLKPDFGAAYGDLAFAASENQNYQLTLGALEKRASLLPETPITYFLRATAYDHLRDYKDASVNYHKFLEAAEGKFPDQEWQARHRLIAIEPKK